MMFKCAFAFLSRALLMLLPALGLSACGDSAKPQNAPPQVSFGMMSGQSFDMPVLLEIRASDENGIEGFSRVFIDETSLGTAGPLGEIVSDVADGAESRVMTVRLNQVPGQHTLSLRVTDDTNPGQSTDASWTYTMLPPDGGGNTPPTISFEGITDGQTVQPGHSFTIRLEDPDDSLTAMRLFLDALGLIHETTATDPRNFAYEFTVEGDAASVGPHALRVQANNDALNVNEVTLNYTVAPLL